MTDAIELINVSKNLGDFRIDQMNLQIPKGYITGFIGPNGAGKSTTIRLIMDLVKADAGEIKILGLDHQEAGKAARDRIGFVYPENVFYENLTVEAIGKVVGGFYSKWDKGIFRQLCQDFSLPAKKKVKDLSTGMKVKLSLAVALSHHADLIILDEPTSGLDPLVRSEILDLLYDLIQDQNKTVFFSSHITTDLEKIADYVVLIQDGRIVMDEAKDDLLDRFRLVKGATDLLDADTRSLLAGLKETSAGFVGLTQEADTFCELYGDKVLIEPASLEEIMVYSLKGAH
ncbi:phenol-soluble modulin export ABC transporter ATP-binding protein PmtA [Aerococcus sanguinicola]|uniref:phenol-soluble modulin export ABC transporter ATP-binding protein PmtA n=1 Tax=unclassified Aerococcus TaxID=2618060 RepID=UPI0008A46EC5|nr:MULTISPECIES: ABC transporter ATP-binding protein [unclassified Aerococcus]KAB0647885.1 ABC transporter ATP-binding protein [Aerococcus sanguinicola]MDK6234226.1 ABC transporter ATP-binding protein [Aerococcus sp. UMB10185]MDK6856457.1 ABC transporter ATP-binding protein [Aerococcus sp. UMB7533]OFN01670.1 sodium ABC transporter ATP-binding protein [Aerococcus sp. HMSC062A02]OHO44024.1 sodium ABC transporter ATP-binding protein [Aerococcus sp. HMSC035B07]